MRSPGSVFLEEPDGGLAQQPLVGQSASATRRLQVQLGVLPWVVFTLTTGLFAFTDGTLQVVVWAVSAASVLLSGLFVVIGYREGKSTKVALGVLCLASILVGIPVGLLIWGAYMEEYSRLDNGGTYKNLSPTDPATAHSDATMVKFVEGSVVDVDKSIGYMKAGTVYCAAPIVESAQGSAVSAYWAVGVDCCDQKGGFSCGAVENSDARSGIVAVEHLGYYEDAVRMSTATFDLPQGNGDYAYVRWVNDLDAYKDDLLISGVSLVVAASLLHLVASVTAGFVLSKAINRQAALKRPA